MDLKDGKIRRIGNGMLARGPPQLKKPQVPMLKGRPFSLMRREVSQSMANKVDRQVNLLQPHGG